ncbi:LacI family DNA-binding transcriptional regulator [Arthrobacter sp. AL12]|uniref:LacI family DNA-binding transcriptional regulator n=1 Tax=Arthrobacter sp. AL12 TaxID=3042241 RepID=UPI00249A6428|nr:LacI family DNA-binding transcriptional regulator [Arthrobacter sp. AL12]MDI3212218.1 LacI family DNA-binding transcriptional regulator [Arthrobacter sp. AL12]
MQDHATSVATNRPAPPVSAAAVARAAGVSQATVSYVLNGKGGVSPETRRHINHVANELGFRPRKSSQSTDVQRTRVIGLILPNIINPMFPRWAQGVISAAAESGYEVFVATTQDDPDVLAQVTSTLATRNVDGIILAASLRDDATALRTLRAARIPYVCLSRRADFLDSDFVGIDDDAAATMLMQHMLSHGFTEIATVIGPRFSTASLAREQAFVRTAAAAGITISGDRKISTRVNNEGGRLAAERLFSGGTPPQAVVCGSDELAIGVMEYALARGLRIPGDVAVAGCDGLPHSRSGLINLTSIVQPQQEMAHEAFAMLLKRIEAPSAGYSSKVCPHRLHIGRTCGCTPPSR